MGAWLHVLRYDWPKPVRGNTRKSSASPATGYASVHKEEQQAIVDEAFNV